jgi:transcription elongation GreA/GreB family factor
VVEVGDVVDVQDGELREWWRIVPHHEADAMRRRIPENSSLGRALLGHEVGEVVRVRAPEEPAGRAVTILAVQRPGAE